MGDRSWWAVLLSGIYPESIRKIWACTGWQEFGATPPKSVHDPDQAIALSQRRRGARTCLCGEASYMYI